MEKWSFVLSLIIPSSIGFLLLAIKLLSKSLKGKHWVRFGTAHTFLSIFLKVITNPGTTCHAGQLPAGAGAACLLSSDYTLTSCFPKSPCTAMVPNTAGAPAAADRPTKAISSTAGLWVHFGEQCGSAKTVCRRTWQCQGDLECGWGRYGLRGT